VTVRGFTLAADWSRSGGFGGTLEDVTGYVSADTDIAITIGRDTSQAASELNAGTLDFALEDQGLNFAPDKSTSPIFGKVAPGVPFSFTYTVAAATTTLMAGPLDDFTYDPQLRKLSGQVLDAWGSPGDETLSTLVYSGKRTGDLIGIILDAIGWTGGRDIDPGATVPAFWWAEGKDAKTAIQELVDSEGPPAIAYVEGGVFTFRDRHHRLLRSASQNSQGTYTHIYPEGTGPGSDFKVLAGSFTYRHGRRSIVNSASFQVDVRTPGVVAPVWSTDSAISVPAGSTVDTFVQSSEAFVGAITPLQGIDFSVAGGPVTVSLSRTSGQSLVLSVTSTGTDALVDAMQIRAAPIVSRTVKVEVEDAGSVGAKGRRGWGRSLPWANQYDALAIAQRIVATYATARPVLTFTVDALLGTTYAQQFLLRKISDRITVRNDILGINGPFIIERITRRIRQLGARGIELEITCEAPEPTQAVNALTFDVAGKGFNDGAFGVDGVDAASTVFRFDVAGQGFNAGRFAS
jgi:hypothetical protein